MDEQTVFSPDQPQNSQPISPPQMQPTSPPPGNNFPPPPMDSGGGLLSKGNLIKIGIGIVVLFLLIFGGIAIVSRRARS